MSLTRINQFTFRARARENFQPWLRNSDMSRMCTTRPRTSISPFAISSWRMREKCSCVRLSCEAMTPLRAGSVISGGAACMRSGSWLSRKAITRCVPERTPDGYVALIDEKGIRIVADGFVGTNECRLDANQEWLYVVESNARRISRLRVRADGSLTDREIFGPPDLGGVPDGFAFDAFGNLWITLVMYDRLIALTPEGDVITLLDDGVPEQVAALDHHYQARTLTPELMLKCKGTLAPWMASVTFGGPDLRTVYLGSLMGTTIPYFRAPVPGLPMVHWHERQR